jgi:hypothetical protein
MLPVYLGICFEMITITSGLTLGPYFSMRPHTASFFKVVEHPWADHWPLIDVSHIVVRLLMKVASHLIDIAFDKSR